MSARSTTTATGADRFAVARAVADAVLCEGNVLYPYRASARKNRLRWQFGVLAPADFVTAAGSEASRMQAEIPIESGAGQVLLRIRMRCLQVRERLVEVAMPGGGHEPVDSLEVAGDLHTTFDESVEREVEIGPLELSFLLGGAEATELFELQGGESIEPLGGNEGGAWVLRRSVPVRGQLSARAHDLGDGLAKLSVAVDNLTPWQRPLASRDELMRHCLVGVHLLVALDGGRAVSLLDPPDQARRAVAGCASTGCFPVLIGPPGDDDLVLASPIIVYDHPEVAPESPGDMCDSTEIDEILALRTLTLTEEEKREARATDPRSAAILDRVDALPPEVFERLHAVMRPLVPAVTTAGSPPPASHPMPVGSDVLGGAPWWDPGADASVDPASDAVTVGGRVVSRGAGVRLRPGPGGDAQDIFLAGRTATVGGVFRDVDGGVHLAVTLEDDPAADLHDRYGRYRYFRPEEVEVLDEAAQS